MLNRFLFSMIVLASLGVHVHEACVGLLLEKRANTLFNIHEKDNDGMTAPIYASEGGQSWDRYRSAICY